MSYQTKIFRKFEEAQRKLPSWEVLPRYGFLDNSSLILQIQRESTAYESVNVGYQQATTCSICDAEYLIGLCMVQQSLL